MVIDYAAKLLNETSVLSAPSRTLPCYDPLAAPSVYRKLRLLARILLRTEIYEALSITLKIQSDE